MHIKGVVDKYVYSIPKNQSNYQYENVFSKDTRIKFNTLIKQTKVMCVLALMAEIEIGEVQGAYLLHSWMSKIHTKMTLTNTTHAIHYRQTHQ